MQDDEVVVMIEGVENPPGSFFFSIVVHAKRLKGRRIRLSTALEAFINKWIREEAG